MTDKWEKRYREGQRLERSIYLILMKAGVTGPELDECIEWAFGKGALEVPPREWAERWNKLHPRSFQVKKEDSFVKFVFVVGNMFAQEKEEIRQMMEQLKEG